MASTKNYILLVLLGVLAIISSAYLISNQNQTNSTPKVSDSEAEELASKMILLTHWKFIQDSVNDIKSINIQINDEEQIEEVIAKLDFMSSEFQRHSDNIKQTGIIEKYEPIKEKMIMYTDTITSSLNHLSQGYNEFDSNKIQLATDELDNAKEIENEISLVISVW